MGFSYRYNPLSLEVFPPAPPEFVGAVFIDDVYFVPGADNGNVSSVPTSSGTGNPSASSSPTLGTVPSGVPSTSASPSVSEQQAVPLLPPGAKYYEGFERGIFPEAPEWSTVGGGLDDFWEITTERTKSGVYSIKSPDLSNDELMPLKSSAKFTTDAAWGAGTVVFSVLAGVNMPFDQFRYMVDGQMRGGLSDKSVFETLQITLGPGSHEIEFQYEWNSARLTAFPPESPDRIAAVYIDDVYFLPDGVTVTPTISPTSSSPTVGTESSGVPSTSAIPTVLEQGTSSVPSPASVPSSIAPTSFPPGAEYYDGFEQGKFPDDSEWETKGDAGLWELTTERANTGVYSIKTPDFVNLGGLKKTSNVTLTTDSTWPAGFLVFSILSSVNMPYDDLKYYVDGNARGAARDIAEFNIRQIQLGPGEHRITFSYQMNPANLDALPPLPAGGIEPVFIDDVYFLPDGFTIAPTGPPMTASPTSVPEKLPTTSPTVSKDVSTSLPSGLPTGVVCRPPTSAPASVTSSIAPTSIPPSDSFFDGFESGDFTGLEWNITGEQAWMVDNTRPFQGNFSAHVRTEDIEKSKDNSQLNLAMNLGSAAFIQFYFYAPVEMPFESFDLWVDEQFLTGLSTEDETWTQAGAILSSGQHTVSWRLSKNPRGVPDQQIDNLPQKPFRLGEVWLDDVSLQSSTPSFYEDWESGDFMAHPWILSGDAEWSLTQSSQYEGCYSATIASSDIQGNSGISELSIDLITEEGGVFKFEVLPSVSGPFDIAEVFIDETAVVSYAAPLDDWLAQEIIIQPGKRRVSFKFSKNPGGIPENVLPTLSAPAGHLGQMWLDGIAFEVTQSTS